MLDDGLCFRVLVVEDGDVGAGGENDELAAFAAAARVAARN